MFPLIKRKQDRAAKPAISPPSRFCGAGKLAAFPKRPTISDVTISTARCTPWRSELLRRQSRSHQSGHFYLAESGHFYLGITSTWAPPICDLRSAAWLSSFVIGSMFRGFFRSCEMVIYSLI